MTCHPYTEFNSTIVTRPQHAPSSLRCRDSLYTSPIRLPKRVYEHMSVEIFGELCTLTRQGRPRTSREVALARTRVQRRRPRVFGQTFAAVRRKTPARSVSDRPARADRVARVILEPRASSDEHLMSIASS